MSSPKNEREDELFTTIRRELDRAVAMVSPRLSADQRDDLVQVAALRLLKIWQKSEGKKEFTASYLWRTAYSALVDESRRRRRRQEEALENPKVESSAVSLIDPAREYGGREIGGAVQDCLQLMVRPRRLAVVLYLQGHSVPESARLLGWSRKRTENLVYRGLADLRRCLTDKGLRP